ncbi:sodium solute symporter [Aureococcus anophagefferens]|nr:sodium solute symporter [Aureococcus anophagefferens]
MSGRLLQEAQPYTVPEGGAMGILFGVLCLTGLLCVAGIVLDKGSTFKDVLRPGDGFLSARGQSAWYSIALSFFASGMGAWIVYGTTEMGATRPISWWGVIGYSTASAFPAVLLCWLGPRIKTVVGAASGFSATDFALSRYGRLMHLHVCCISCFYMYIYMVAELTSIGNVYATLVGKSVAGDDSEHFTTKIAICVALFTWAYTALAGLPASILTDKFQGVVITCVVIMLLVATTTLKSNEVSKQEYDDATGWFSKGFEALVTLWIAICSAELFNQGNWQRVWAARSDKDMKIGFLAGAVLVTLVMLFFGVMGTIAYARDRESYDTWQKLAYLSFFDLLRNLPRFWHYVTLALLTTLAASSLDTLQNGIASVLSRDLLKQKLNTNWSRLRLYDKSAFAYFWGINSKSDGSPYECALCGTKLMVTFIVVPLVSAAATVIFSYVDVYVGGDKAKQPFIIVPRLDGDDDALLPAKDLELDAIQVADDDKKSPDEELTN